MINKINKQELKREDERIKKKLKKWKKENK